MTEKHKTIIRKQLEQLVNLSAENIVTKLVSEDIITVDDMEAILVGHTTHTDKARALLMLLLKKEDQAFYVLIIALRDKTMRHLARLLEDAGTHTTCTSILIQ